MKAKVLPPTSRVEIIGRCEYDGIMFTWADVNVLEELKSADGLMERLVIFNKHLARSLVNKGYAFENIRGSYGHTEKFLKVADKMIATITEGLKVSCQSAKAKEH